MATTVASRKAKGRRLQNKIAEDIRNVTGLTYEDVRPAIMGERGCDIKLSSKAKSLWRFGTETKNVEKLNFWKAWDQATKNATDEGLCPALVVHKNGSQVLVTIPWKEFLGFVKAANEAKS